MAILYNLDPLTAIDLFYYGVGENGVWEGDLIKNEKKRGLVLPHVLREFLSKYAYLDINAGGENGFKIFHPDGMAEIVLHDENGAEIRLLVIGKLNDDLWVAVRPDTEDLEIAFGHDEDGGTMWSPADGTLSGIFVVMFCSRLFGSSDSFVFDNDFEIGAVLKKYGAERSKILPSEGNAQHISICYDDQALAFLAAEFDKPGENITMLHVVPRKPPDEHEAEKYSSVSFEELERLFEAEFYGNSLNCDYGYALDIQLEIIKRLEAARTEETELIPRYRLAGRCCWALRKLEEADIWYGRGLAAAEGSAADAPGVYADFLHTVAIYYANVGRAAESGELFEKELALRKERIPGDVYHLGRNYEVRAQLLENDDSKLDRVIELCELALEEFKKDPHESGCKYEIARTQQLRGNARRRKKELARNAGSAE